MNDIPRPGDESNTFDEEALEEAWRGELQISNHRPMGNEFNVHLAMTKCPLFRGKIAFDRRLFKPVIGAGTPAGYAGEWSDAHTARTAIWLQGQGIQAKPKTVDCALLAVAHENEIDPLEDWLMGIEWDGQERIGTWLAAYARAEETIANIIMGSKFLIGAVARALKPGCRMDYMPVLEGAQGAKKSTLIKILGGDYTGENLPDFHSKDAMLTAGTKWIIEVSELAAIRKSELEQVKSFVTRLEDTFRPPYGRYNVTVKRRCVLIGNLNPDGTGYLQDATGNRRFWPVKVGDIDITSLKRDRTQIWAEAVHCFLRGDHWWLTSEETGIVAEQQQLRLTEDPWETTIGQWASAQVGTFTTLELAKGALDIAAQDINRGVATRIGIVLNQLGFMRKRVRDGITLKWVYLRPEEP